MQRTLRMYESLKLPWSATPSPFELVYRSAGLIKTKGTIYLLPPPRQTLVDTFNAPPRPKTRGSAGNVALCKHFERNGASSEHSKPHPFWTLPVGNDGNKNAIASRILEEMLDGAQWRNVMLLHRGVAVYEIRNGEGYGMRWTLDVEEVEGEKVGMEEDELDGSKRMKDEDAEKEWSIVKASFRGFLEPIVKASFRGFLEPIEGTES